MNLNMFFTCRGQRAQSFFFVSNNWFQQLFRNTVMFNGQEPTVWVDVALASNSVLFSKA